MPEGPQRTRLDWKNLGKYAPDVDDPRRTPDAGGSGDAETPGPVCGASDPAAVTWCATSAAWYADDSIPD